MRLDTLFHGIPVLEKIHWEAHRPCKKITSDSRAIESGDVFVACPGSRMDGHDFLGQAVMARAGVLVCEKLPEFPIPRHITLVRVKNSQAVLAELLNRYYQNPHEKVKLVGVTGTNGKTTMAYLLHRLLSETSRAAYLGTLWYQLPHRKLEAPNTTPGAEVLIPLLADMRSEDIPYCVMEVSSHALHQRRVHDLQFELAVFTQLTQDHLDYHKNMESYFQAKRLFFSENPSPRQMLINKDCSYGLRLLEEFPQAKSFSLESGADYQATDIIPSFQGSHFKMRFKGREVAFQVRLPMRHNVANIVTVLSALDLLGYDPEDFRGALQEISGIPGRLERISTSEDFQVFVDYAHTPDAIENVLSEAKKLNPHRILTLFGCGGDRDRTKRPLMTQAACRWSDVVMLTSDNPRSEDPAMILKDIKKGLPPAKFAGPQVIETIDRREAIEKLIQMAEPGDVLFILGKGHEDYQILGDKKIPFDDRLVVQDCLRKKARVFFS
ncbi:MAG: UDP-N-acetylmuramoyl-L-alanyl-D-glutamate--2,6-diaminopimelate ligase [Candidatus Omnitrophica bacterium]|nr:UDP-N-acetylmuramoyl-L-alanyl-D-glutamate--2,6-diaminopimelate ligase [Candidatus Omnitrophota bacterium]